MRISVGVIQRTPLATQLLCRALTGQRKHFSVVPCGHTSQEFVQMVSANRPDVVVISAALQGDAHAGLKIVRQVRTANPKTRIVVLLDCSESQQVIDAFSAGAAGVACQTDPLETLCKCIRSVHEGQIWANSQELQWIVQALGEREPVRVRSVKGEPLLTKREAEIVILVAEGLTNNEIGLKLGVTAHTVKNHLFRIYEKLGISSRMELNLYVTRSRERSRGSSITTRGDA